MYTSLPNVISQYGIELAQSSQTDSIQLNATPPGPTKSFILMTSHRSDLHNYNVPVKVQLHTSYLIAKDSQHAHRSKIR